MPEVLEWMGYGLCHQLPERSLFGGGVQLPVCARDTGIYLGFVIALLLLRVLSGRHRASELPPAWSTAVLAVFVLVMVFDGVTSYAGLRETTNELRLLTGLTTGFAIAAFTLPLLNSQLWRDSDRRRVLGCASEMAVFVLWVPVSFFILWTLGPLLGVAYPWVVAVAIIVTFSTVNLLILTLLPPFERKVSRLSQAWLAMTLALVLTVVELSMAAAFRVWMTRLAESLA